MSLDHSHTRVSKGNDQFCASSAKSSICPDLKEKCNGYWWTGGSSGRNAIRRLNIFSVLDIFSAQFIIINIIESHSISNQIPPSPIQRLPRSKIHSRCSSTTLSPPSRRCSLPLRPLRLQQWKLQLGKRPSRSPPLRVSSIPNSQGESEY